MTPYQLAKTEFTNYQNDGSCIGIGTAGLLDASIPADRHDKCLLAKKPIMPCRYFEQCVLPLANQPDSAGGSIDGVKRAGWIEARNLYPFPLANNAQRAVARTCPDCNQPLARRQRVCVKCQKKRRTESYRQYRQSRKVS